MNKWSRKLIVCGITASSVTALAYDPVTHNVISDYSVQQSTLNDSSTKVLDALGLGTSADDRDFLLPSTSPYPLTLTPQRLIDFGAQEEDAGTRSRNHFFDSQNGGAALNVPLAYPSPDWALQDNVQVSGQVFSYKDAKQYFYQALTGPAKSDRDRNLGLTFESLGHVIHHLQDMAQPQHVRNDSHCDRVWINLFESFFLPLPICLFSKNPSAYEAFTTSRGSDLPLANYDVVDYNTFNNPRLLWSNSGLGIAEFTGKNFVSIGTNLTGEPFSNNIAGDRAHPLPDGTGFQIEKKQITDSSLLGPNQPLSGEIWFLGTPVTDSYRSAQSAFNSRTSTFSVFASDLMSYNAVQGHRVPWTFTLNQFNYRAANEFLLKRAAAFSAGLINYFFRGRIEISLPKVGVYSVLDHAVTNAAGQGFTKFKVNLRNITPGALQAMSQGTLQLIAKYYVNNCYTPDLLGEFDGNTNYFTQPITFNGCFLSNYFGGIEKITVSAQLTGQSLRSDAAQEFTFTFPSNQPIPINAHDLSIQVVYSGVLGAESDAIVVSGSNISEPTYIAVLNSSDYFIVDGQFYTPTQIRNDPNLLQRVQGSNFDPESLGSVDLLVAGNRITSPIILQPKQYMRIAVLGDAEIQPPLQNPPPIPVTIEAKFPSATSGSNPTFAIPPIRNQLARAPGILSAITIARGVPHWFMIQFFKFVGTTPPSNADLSALAPLDPTCIGPGGTPTCVPSPTQTTLLF